MPRKVDPEILDEFFEETTGYFPAVRAVVESLADASPGALEEAYRYAHTIKGAASIVGFSTLGHVAFRLEDVLETLHRGERAVDAEVEGIARTLAECVEAYCRLLERDGEAVDARPFVEPAVQAYHRFIGVAESRDADVAAQILKNTPLRPEALVDDARDGNGAGDYDHALQSDLQAVDEAGRGSGADEVRAFLAEGEERLRRIVQSLTTEVGPFEDPACIAAIRADVGALRDGAAAAGCGPVARLAGRMDDLWARLAAEGRSASSPAAALLMESLSYLEDMIAGWEAGRFDGVVEEILTKYDSIHELSGSGEQESWSACEPAIGSDAIVGVAEAELFQTPTLVDPAPPAAGTAPCASPEVAPELLEAAPEIPEELMAVYVEEAEDHLRKMMHTLPQIEAAADPRPPVLELRRVVHTLKGASGAVGFRAVAQLSHRMEDLLDRLYDGRALLNPSVMKLLYETTDVLEDFSRDGGPPPAPERLMRIYSAYSRLLNGETAEAAPAAVAPAPEAAPVPAPRVAPRAVPAEVAAVAVVPPSEPADEPAAAGAASSGAAAARTGEMVRVPIERLDELVKLVGELVVNRTAFEERMTQFERVSDEFRRSVQRLKQVSTTLESEYEVDALRQPAALAAGGGNGSGGADFSRFEALKGAVHQEFDEIEFDRYTEFHLLSRSLAETAGDVSTVESEVHNLIGDLDALLVRQSRLSRDVQDRLMRMRMVPLATLASRLHRAVRTVASQQEKLVDLVLEGEQVELDKSVLEEIADPLLHLLRNAVGHGIETPDGRRADGKRPRGTVRVRAFHQGAQVAIEVSDDGGGLSTSAIRGEAVRRGFMGEAEAAALSEADAAQLIFLPGLSTAREISEVSGRGVGLDVVKTQVHKLKGTIAVSTAPGRGTTFLIRLPMTLAITQALLVKTYGHTFAVPIQAVLQIQRIDRSQVVYAGSAPMIEHGGRVYRFVQLGELLGLPAPAAESAAKETPVLFLDAGGEQIAAAVDRVLFGKEIVVMTLGSQLRRVHRFMGATLLGDGAVVPILNPGELLEKAVRVEAAGGEGRASDPRAARTVLVVDDSVSVRRVTCNLLKNAGLTAIPAKDGLDAQELLQRDGRRPDLVLLDVEMPRMDGYEFLASLRRDDRFRRTPVVMVTSRAGDKHRAKAMELGATDYLVKPFEDRKLLSLVQQLIQAAAAAAEAS